MAGNAPQVPCEIVLSGKPSASGGLYVRCRCMACPPTYTRFWDVLPLGVVVTLSEALDVWRQHVALMNLLIAEDEAA